MHVTEFEDKESICKVSIAMCYMINVIYKIVLLNSPNIPNVTQVFIIFMWAKNNKYLHHLIFVKFKYFFQLKET